MLELTWIFVMSNIYDFTYYLTRKKNRDILEFISTNYNDGSAIKKNIAGIKTHLNEWAEEEILFRQKYASP